MANTNTWVASYDSSVTTTPEALKTAVLSTTNAGSVKLFTDSTYAANASTLADASNVLMLTSADNTDYRYYNISGTGNETVPIGFSVASGKIQATVKAGLSLSNSSDFIFFIAAYDGNRMVAIDYSEPVLLETANAELDYNNTYTYKAVLWTYGLVPLDINIYQK